MKKYVVRLTPEEHAQLLPLTRRGKVAARTLLHARILLKADSGPEAPAWSDEAISEALEVHATTVARVPSALWKKAWKRPCGRNQPGVSTRANWTGQRKRI